VLTEGTANQDMVWALMIEVSTVKKHVGNLLSKLDATRRTQARARALRRYLPTAPPTCAPRSSFLLLLVDL
jgi:LuxR family maltose regulon positive regulatory protein